MVHTDVVIAINAPETGSTMTRVVGAAIDAGGTVETKVVGQKSGGMSHVLPVNPPLQWHTKSFSLSSHLWP